MVRAAGHGKPKVHECGVEVAQRARPYLAKIANGEIDVNIDRNLRAIHTPAFLEPLSRRFQDMNSSGHRPYEPCLFRMGINVIHDWAVGVDS